jgi:hypothetical protein
VIAQSVDDLHGANKFSKQTALTEAAEPVKGRGVPVNTERACLGHASVRMRDAP